MSQRHQSGCNLQIKQKCKVKQVGQQNAGRTKDVHFWYRQSHNCPLHGQGLLFMTHLIKIEGGAKIIVHENFTVYSVTCAHNQHHTWPSLNWSPPKADTHGLIPPVPRAIITKPRAASALEEKHWLYTQHSAVASTICIYTNIQHLHIYHTQCNMTKTECDKTSQVTS